MISFSFLLYNVASKKVRQCTFFKLTSAFIAVKRFKTFNVKALTNHPPFDRCVRNAWRFFSLHLRMECVVVREGQTRIIPLPEELSKLWKRWDRNRRRERMTDVVRDRNSASERKRMKGRQSTSGHTQPRHGHHKWLKTDFPFRQPYQSLHSVMEAKVKRAWSTAFASSNHRRDVFKESGWSGDGERLHRELFYYYSLFKWGILPVYPAAEGKQHFVWGHLTNISPIGWWPDRREGCDSIFIIPWCYPLGEGGLQPLKQRWKLHHGCSEEEERNEYWE